MKKLVTNFLYVILTVLLSVNVLIKLVILIVEDVVAFPCDGDGIITRVTTSSQAKRHDQYNSLAKLYALLICRKSAFDCDDDDGP